MEIYQYRPTTNPIAIQLQSNEKELKKKKFKIIDKKAAKNQIQHRGYPHADAAKIYVLVCLETL